MATTVPLFLRVMCAAAGLTFEPDGTIARQGRALSRVPLLPDGRIAGPDYFKAIETVRAAAGDDATLVAGYAARLNLDDIGVLGLAFKTAPTLRGSLTRIERYYALVTDSVVYRLDEGTDPARFVIEARTPPDPAHGFRNACALAAFAANMRAFVGEGLTFDHVSFRHEVPAPGPYAGTFGCEVRFGATADALHLAPAMLGLPNRLGDPGVSAFLTGQLDAATAGAAPDLAAEITRHLGPLLPGGVPSAGDTASALGLSERTLFRRLAEAGLTYQGVVQAAQEARARDLLARETCAIAEVAFLTGFAEQSTFSRAFKRWTGVPPAVYRKGLSPA